jgi:hypothetical protein
MAIELKTVLSTQAARQGDTGNGVRYVLGISLALAIVTMFIAMTFTT